VSASLRRRLCRGSFLVAAFAFAFLTAAPLLHAGDDSDEYDNYKVRGDLFWFYSSPSGSFQGSDSTDRIDLQHDLGFGNYSTFTGVLDWHFTHKNHLTFTYSPFQQSRNAVLNRTVTYQGQTYQVGAAVRANLRADLYAPGYQYDIIRRQRGHLGVGVQIDLFNAKASLSAHAQVTGGGNFQPSAYGSASLLAPIPVAGPEYRFYITNSPRLFVEGNVYGMYLFGYGNFVSTTNDLGFTINKHLSVNAGYSLGSRLVVNNQAATRIGLRLTQQGAVVGLEGSF
jgi:hypothetical protein